MSSNVKPKTRRRSSVHEHAKKASKVFDSWGKGISKGITAGVTKTKNFAIEKVVKVEPTPESKPMMDALSQFNELKQTIESFSDGTLSNLYNTQSNESIFNLKLSETLMSLHSQQDNLFNNFAENIMGRKLFKLNAMTNEYLIKMEKEMIGPINFMMKELKKTHQKLKKYKSVKTDFDFCCHKYQKLSKQKKKNKVKIAAAKQKKEEKLVNLNLARTEIISNIRNLETKKQIDLLTCFDTFWISYLIFANRQAQIVSLKDKFDQQYEDDKKQIFENDEHTNQENIISDEEVDEKTNENNENFEELMKSTSLRVAETMSSHNEISKELRYKNPVKLGSGAFATVYKANDLLTNEREVAIKKICIGDGNNVLYLSSTKDEAENELKILKTLSGHNNVIALVDDYYEETVYKDVYLNLVMEYIPNTLRSRFDFYGESGDAIPHNLICSYSFQLLRAVNWLHIMKIIHCDIKPDNVLIDVKTHTLKLCDFGCSKKVKNRYYGIADDEMRYDESELLEEKEGGLQSYVCSRYYRAPELILQSGYYDCKVDIWSVGCVIAEMFLGTLLFEGYNNEKEQLDDIVKKLGVPKESDIDDMNADYVHKEELLHRNEIGESWEMLFCAVMDMPQSAIELISKTLIYSPKERINAIECLVEPYFDDLAKNEKYKYLFDWNKIEIKYAKANGINLLMAE